MLKSSELSRVMKKGAGIAGRSEAHDFDESLLVDPIRHDHGSQCYNGKVDRFEAESGPKEYRVSAVALYHPRLKEQRKAFKAFGNAILENFDQTIEAAGTGLVAQVDTAFTKATIVYRLF